MPPVRRTGRRNAHYKAPPIRKETPTEVGYRLVRTSGVVTGPIHKQLKLSNGKMAERTVCGNWPAIADAPSDVLDDRCPVCFRIPSRPSEGASK